MWWHMACGRFFVENGYYPPNDSFTFGVVSNSTSNSKTWLGDIILYLIYDYSGVFGLYIFRIIGMILPVLVMLKYTGKHNEYTLCLAILIIVGTLQIHIVRNSIFALYFIPAIMYIWHTKKYLVWLLPVLFFLWSRMHGYCIVGIFILGLLFIGHCIDNFKSYKTLFILPVIVISYFVVENQVPLGLRAIAGNLKNALVNGNIIDIFRIFITGGDSDYVLEYTSPLANPETLIFKVIIFFAILYFILLFFKKNKWSEILPSIATIFLGFGYLRSTPFMFLVAVPLIAQNIKSKTKAFIILPYLCISIFTFSAYYFYLSDQFHKFIGILKYNVTCGVSIVHTSKIPKYVLDNYKDEKIYNSYNTGSLLLWEWYGKKKVYIDNRSINYSKEYFDDWKHNFASKYMTEFEIDKAICSTIIEPDEIKYFLSKNWYVDKFDNSMVFLTKEFKYPEFIGYNPDRMPWAYRYRFSKVYCYILQSLLMNGSIDHAEQFSKIDFDISEPLKIRFEYHLAVLSNIKKYFSGNHPYLGILATDIYLSKTDEDLQKAFRKCRTSINNMKKGRPSRP